MNRNPQGGPKLLGNIEPHAPLLNIPPASQLLYKVMKVEHLLRSVEGSYLHFNRVDSYNDFPNADPQDGQQLHADLQGNTATKFEKSPNFSAADYYNRSRSRTYACCFSLENSDFIWSNYSNGSEKGKVCVVFEFGMLRSTINRTLKNKRTRLQYGHNLCHQIFDVNYGIVEYVDWISHRCNMEHLPNPIEYTYLKDKRFSDEKELRISLSAMGIGQFVLSDGSTICFPDSLQMPFDFRPAMVDGTISQILYVQETDSDYLFEELEKFGIAPSK